MSDVNHHRGEQSDERPERERATPPAGTGPDPRAVRAAAAAEASYLLSVRAR
jgi:hypothetical protein